MFFNRRFLRKKYRCFTILWKLIMRLHSNMLFRMKVVLACFFSLFSLYNNVTVRRSRACVCSEMNKAKMSVLPWNLDYRWHAWSSRKCINLFPIGMTVSYNHLDLANLYYLSSIKCKYLHISTFIYLYIHIFRNESAINGLMKSRSKIV